MDTCESSRNDYRAFNPYNGLRDTKKNQIIDKIIVGTKTGYISARVSTTSDLSILEYFLYLLVAHNLI